MIAAPQDDPELKQQQPSYEDFQRDYWAPDRDQVLANMAPKPPDLERAPGAGSGVYDPSRNVLGPGGSLKFQPTAPSVSAPTNPLPNSGVSGYGTPQTPGMPLPGSPQPTGAPTGSAAPPWTQTATPAGFDANKWNDPNKSDPKYDVGHMVASGMSNEQIGQYLSQKYPGYTIVGNDKIRDPNGDIYDFRFDQEGANKPMWEGVSGPGFSGGGAGGTGTASGSIGAGGAGGPANSAFSDQVRQILLGQLGGLTGPVTANDPAIKAEMDAQGATLERNRVQRRAADAERAAMNGLLNGGQSSGSFEQNIASGFEDKGQQLTGIQAQLFTREIQSRRTQVAQLLNMAMQSGDAESARALQYQLALMDDALRRLGLQQQQSQFDSTFGLDAARFQYGKDKDLAMYGAGY